MLNSRFQPANNTVIGFSKMGYDTSYRSSNKLDIKRRFAQSRDNYVGDTHGANSAQLKKTLLKNNFIKNDFYSIGSGSGSKMDGPSAYDYQLRLRKKQLQG